MSRFAGAVPPLGMRAPPSISCLSLVLAAGLLLPAACSSPASGGGAPATAPTDDAGNDTGAPIDEDTAPVDPVEDTAPPALTYPAGPYGLDVGKTFPNLSFQGYRDAKGEWTTLSMIDHYDPDGSRGITGIYLVLAALWCGPCNLEAGELPKYFAKDYKPRGAHFVTAVLEDGSRKPATQTAVDQWVKAHGITFDIAADPKKSAAPIGSFGLPYNYVINPRTMKIVKIIPGVDGSIVPCGSGGTCATDYVCSPTLNTCLPSGALGPIYGLDAVMNKNGATKFDTGIK